ncbi:MAG: aminopeptidase P family protein [Pseudomonadota bacterium]
MFQSFEDQADPARAAPRIAALREEMTRTKVDAFLIPRGDAHQGEYVAPCDERLSWLTGFTGSAGMAAVTAGSAALFTDGRYTLQVRDQCDEDLFDFIKIPEGKPSDWLIETLANGATVGFDPMLHSIAEIERLRAALGPRGITISSVTQNLVDAIWSDRPAPPTAPVFIHPVALAGRAASDKRADIADALRAADTDAMVLTLTDSIAWLLNIRGKDVAHTPVALAFALVHAEAPVDLFIAEEKITPEVAAHLADVARVCAPDALGDALDQLSGKSVRLDPQTAAWWFTRRLEDAGARVTRGRDLVLDAKARKNAAEIAGSRSAHVRDGVAMSTFLAWLDAHAATGEVTEISAAQQLEACRAATGELRDISFDTISGAGGNGAIVHYRVTEATDTRLETGTLYLVDSGGQYSDGTTDITRTVAIGAPDDEARRCFTLVLKGHIAIARARFPVGTRGVDLDPFARAALWSAGLDFDHGTGHGVGSYLSVHEGPASISRRGMVALAPGMILSNEPGYYREGAFGIRIENLVLVREAENIAGGERQMLSFETLSFAPFDRALIDPTLLDEAERAWVDEYHAEVRARLEGEIADDAVRAWLIDATQPLASP